MRAKHGDTVRLYGYPGTFRVFAGLRPANSPYDYNVVSNRDERIEFGVQDGSVVEVNDQPVPLLSCPIAAPAADYPHVPQFDYSDGPAINAQHAIDAWSYRSSAAVAG